VGRRPVAKRLEQELELPGATRSDAAKPPAALLEVGAVMRIEPDPSSQPLTTTSAARARTLLGTPALEVLAAP
jgi:hypothetical protein